jgi:Rrf2 family protein
MLSQRGRYALKALLHLASAGGVAPRQASAIATSENIPRKFLEAILTELVRAGIVQSVRGKYGGYRLARTPGDITFGEVIRITDGPLALLPCVSKQFYQRCEDCTDEATCALRRVMADVREQVSSVLDSRTLAEALRERDEEDAAAA